MDKGNKRKKNRKSSEERVAQQGVEGQGRNETKHRHGWRGEEEREHRGRERVKSSGMVKLNRIQKGRKTVAQMGEEDSNERKRNRGYN